MKLMRVRIEDIITTICQCLDYMLCTHLLMTLTSSKNTAVLNYCTFIEGIVEQKKQTKGNVEIQRGQRSNCANLQQD